MKLTLALVGLLAFVLFAKDDQPAFRDALNRVPASQRIFFPSKEEANKWSRDGDSGVYFIPNDTRRWWQFWRPAYRPVYWSVGRTVWLNRKP